MSAADLLNERTETVHGVHISPFEHQRYRYINRMELVGIPIFICWYWILSTFTAQDVEFDKASAPTWLLGLQGLLAFVAIMAFFYHSQLWPNTSEDDIFHAMKYLGRWLFLTRHCLILQSVHMAVSFYSVASCNMPLQRLTYGSAVWIGSLGFFVTIQYFTLVHNNADFLEVCKRKTHLRGFCGLLDFRGYMKWVHVPALPLALCDIVFMKSHSTMHSGGCSVLASCILQLFYCVFYVGFIWCNYYATGYFPYAVLHGLKSVGKWIGFIVAQTVLLIIFVGCLWGLSFAPQPWLNGSVNTAEVLYNVAQQDFQA